ncbi:hypothetical protein COCC4DRAFT_153247 [Bipolaris maydis ATCC 48331]|uniref:Uncharacterized protein n=2 Tax=Cochliobolus heterostrophus TaxID=5016 RepID=M2UBQ1_COCH5|nr:uncharacterized protein COCC4DRAFT_153247 [Bipolaris maydis ATCC 48331]EMD85418.1 hypothetical protein COCHEDRAFT_1118831 [Bipolaris maydis C5]ENH99426.1 hypothetical protein COCC4DRAFT_153247 [Bipolaris maydis ATCC 48331]
MRLALQCADGGLALFRFVSIDPCFSFFPAFWTCFDCLCGAPLLLFERIHGSVFNDQVFYFDSERSVICLNSI